MKIKILNKNRINLTGSYNLSNIQSYEIDEGFVYTQNYNETLDSASVVIKFLTSELDIQPLDKVVLYVLDGENEVLRKNLVVNSWQRSTTRQLNTKTYNYSITLISETKLLEGIPLPNLVITNDNVMYVSKSASTTPKTPLIKVDLKTNETTATPVAGNISYELTTDGKLVYGISILKQNENTNTFVFCYDPEVRKAYNVLKFDDEDPLAFVKYDNDVLYSNIGKNLIYCYNKYNNSRYTFERGTSIPSKMEQIGFEVCILNNDGSISWIDEGKNIVSSTMYITLDSTWEVFKQ